jgi:hypothetical protein
MDKRTGPGHPARRQSTTGDLLSDLAPALGVAAALIGLADMAPYVRDTVRRSTRLGRMPAKQGMGRQGLCPAPQEDRADAGLRPVIARRDLVEGVS